MRAGLLGGSFNPIHKGHIKIAKKVLQKLELDKVFFIPAAKHALKDNTGIISYDERCFLIKKAIAEYPYFEISYLDKTDNYSYTDELIKKLKKKYPQTKFYFIIGADNVEELPAWHNYKWLLKNIRLVVVTRPGINKKRWKNLNYLNRLKFIDIKPIDISSSMIRKRIMKNKDITQLVPAIIKHDVLRLYKNQMRKGN